MVLVVRCLICQKELPYSQSDSSELIKHVQTEHPLASQKPRKSLEKTHERSLKAKEDLKALKQNSASLNSLIDREIQTDLAWSHFVKMEAGKSTSLPHSPKENSFKLPVMNKPPLKHQRVEKEGKHPAEHDCPIQEIIDDSHIRSATKVQQPNSKREVNRAENQTKDTQKRRHRRFYKTSIERWRPVGDEKIHCPRCQAYKRPVVRTHTERVTESSFASSLIMTCWPLCFSPCLFPEPTHENLHCRVCDYHLGVYDHKRKVVSSNPELSKA